MTNTVGSIDVGSNNDIAPFQVADLRRVMADADLEDIIDDLVEAFLDDAPVRMQNIGMSVEAASSKEIRTAAHAYKSAAASIGAEQLAELLRRLEVAGAEGDCTRAAALLPLVRVAHDTVVARLREEFGS